MTRKNNNGILITNIQRFSLHDGPGIRTTVFLKGCSLRCPWCSNPENLKPYPEFYWKNGIKGTYGRYYTPDELEKECLKDQEFYDSGRSDPSMWRITSAFQIEQLPGGVTFSGGEALLQMSSLVPVCKSLRENGIHLALETALFVDSEMLELAIQYIDFFYVDMKILDKRRCAEIEKGNLDTYLSNLEKLMQSEVPAVIRVPVIGEYTDSSKNRVAIRDLISKYRDRVLKVELIKEHNLGESKYESLGMDIHYSGVDDRLMDQYVTEIEEVGLPVEVCRI